MYVRAAILALVVWSMLTADAALAACLERPDDALLGFRPDGWTVDFLPLQPRWQGDVLATVMFQCKLSDQSGPKTIEWPKETRTICEGQTISVGSQPCKITGVWCERLCK